MTHPYFWQGARQTFAARWPSGWRDRGLGIVNGCMPMAGSVRQTSVGLADLRSGGRVAIAGSDWFPRSGRIAVSLAIVPFAVVAAGVASSLSVAVTVFAATMSLAPVVVVAAAIATFISSVIVASMAPIVIATLLAVTAFVAAIFMSSVVTMTPVTTSVTIFVATTTIATTSAAKASATAVVKAATRLF